MRDAAGAEEALVAGEGAVDELVDQHEMPRRHRLVQRADGGDRNQRGDAAALHHVDIGAVVDVGRRVAVAAAMTRQEDDLQPVDLADPHGIRRLAPGACDLDPFGAFQRRQVVEPRSADHTQYSLDHPRNSSVVPVAIAPAPRPSNSARSGEVPDTSRLRLSCDAMMSLPFPRILRCHATMV